MNDVTRCPRDGQPLTYNVKRPHTAIAIAEARCPQCRWGAERITLSTPESDASLFFDDEQHLAQLQRAMLGGAFDDDPLMDLVKLAEAKRALKSMWTYKREG